MASAWPVAILAWPPAGHVGIDADGDGLARALVGGDGRQQVKLRLRLHIDLGHPDLDGEGQFRRRLADAGKDDPFGRGARRQGAADFALGDGVGPGPQGEQGLKHRQVGIGLDREGDQRRARPHAAQGVAQHGEMPLEGGARIDVDRRADLLGDPGQGNILAGQNAVAVFEVVHRSGVVPGLPMAPPGGWPNGLGEPGIDWA